MPYAPPRLCLCGEIVASGTYCACQIERQRERKARADAQRPSARERGYDTKWQRERAAYLKLHPVCAECGTQAATIVHHKIPHRGDQKLFWSRSNWMPVCQPCHDGPIQSRERLRHGSVKRHEERPSR